MTPENVVPDCIYGWAASEWEFRIHQRYPADNVIRKSYMMGN